MRIEVKLFAAARQLAGAETAIVELPEGAAVAELRSALREKYPELAELERRAMYAIDADYVDDQTTITPGAEIACIPPVSGG